MLLNCGVREDSWESLELQGVKEWILKQISPEYSLEGLILKLMLQYFGHLMQITDSLEKTLMLRKIEGGRRSGWQRMRRLDGITDSMDMCFSKLRELWWTGRPGMLQSMGSQRVTQDWGTELNWSKQDSRLYLCSPVRKSDCFSYLEGFSNAVPFFASSLFFFLTAFTYESRLSDYSFS